MTIAQEGAPAVLVTGGAGYIGSHVCKALAAAGLRPLVLDNLSTGHAHMVRWGLLVRADLRVQSEIDQIFATHRPAAVIHLAASAYVGESRRDPGKYYRNNVGATINLLDAMRAHRIEKIVFSSSCAVYGNPATVPISETASPCPVNPYGRSKLMVEEVVCDYVRAYGLRAVGLRFFNACGADPDGELREDHRPETHLIPRALMAARQEIPHVEVFGTDYPTPDGTCIRDYVHVSDLASAHLLALRRLDSECASATFNVAIGKGFSVKEVISSVERVTGNPVPARVTDRRPGAVDPPILVADGSAAKTSLGFVPRFTTIDEMIATAWRSLDSEALRPSVK